MMTNEGEKKKEKKEEERKRQRKEFLFFSPLRITSKLESCGNLKTIQGSKTRIL